MGKKVQHRSRSVKPFAISSRGGLSSADARTEPIKLWAQSILEEALEAENRDVFGREYNEHGVEPDWGYRNGTRKGKLKTAKGTIEYSIPQIARRDRPFKSVIRVPFWGYTAALEDLALAVHQDPTLILIGSPKKLPKGLWKGLGSRGRPTPGRASTTLRRLCPASSDNRATMLGTLKYLPPCLELRRRQQIDFSV